MQKFIEVAKAIEVTDVSPAFVKSNRITNAKWEFALLKALRFLQIINDENKPTPKLAWLRLSGKEFQEKFLIIVQEAYRDLLNVVAVKVVGPEALSNYFVTHFDYTAKKAAGATGFFVWAATLGGMELSPELRTVRPSTGQEGQKRSKEIVRGENAHLRAGVVDIPNRTRDTQPDQGEPDATQRTAVQASINMSLDKDTPKEIWQMVLRWLGDKSEPDEQNSD